MSSYSNQELDFVVRTKEIIKQYDNFQINKDEKFEVTLLVNCFVGLLIVPQQKLFDELPNILIDLENWGISQDEVIKILDKNKRIESKSVKNIARHLRNSVAHYRFKVISDNSNEIKEIEFLDRLKDKTETFKATLKVDNIRTFTNKLSDDFIKRMKTSLGI